MLNLILGRSGTGKTEYVRDLLGKKAQAGENKLLLIVPEQFSYSSERALLEKLGPKLANNIEVLSFKRLSDFVNRQVGGISGTKLEDDDKIILLLHALTGIQHSLNFYNLQADKTYFAKDLICLFSEFNKQQITSSDLKATHNLTLNQKLDDIKVIYDEFNALMLRNGYTDSDLEINQVISAIKENNIFEGYTICIDAFKGFTGQELAIIKELEKGADELYVTFTYDDKDTSMTFGAIKETIDSLGSKVNTIPLAGNKRTKKDALLFLEENLFTSNTAKFTSETKDITLFEADTKYDECNFIAASIRKLQREDSMRLSDIAVVTRHEDNYKAELLSALKRFGITIFEDKRQPIINQPLIVYCKALISLLTKKEFSTKDVLMLVKTGLTSLTEAQCLDLENYAFVWNVKGDEWSKDFENCAKNQETQLDAVNVYRAAIIDPIIALKNELPYDCKAKSLDICDKVYKYLEKVDIKKALYLYAKGLDGTDFEAVAIEQNKVWEILVNILNKLATIQGEDEITLTMFYDLFVAACDLSSLGTLPHGLDELTIGSADRTRLNNPKVTFVCGCVEGEFPENIGGNDLLTNNDRKIINEDLALNLSLSNKIAACDERFMAYSALTSSTEKLIVSYHTKAGANEALSPSIIYTDIDERFDNINKIKQNDLDAYFFAETKQSTFKTYASGYHKRSPLNVEEYNTIKEALKGEKAYDKKFEAIETIVNDDPREIKDKKIAESLFGARMELSPSQIETYYSCPFQFFCRYGLKIYPIKRHSLDNQLRGTVIHYVLEQMLNDHKADFTSLTESEVITEVEKYLKQYLDERYKGNALKDVSFKYKYNDLILTIKEVILRMIEEFKVSQFKTIKTEYKVTDSYTNADIRGEIDRIDEFTDSKGVTYIRVVDYKSYVKEFRLDHVIKGLNLQMLIYLFAAKKEFSDTEAGILYFKASGKLQNIEDRNLTPAEIQTRKIEKNQSSGLYLRENEVLEAMEAKKAGLFYNFDSMDCLVSLAEFGMIEDEVSYKINSMVDNLLDGQIPIFPYREESVTKGCKYCEYSHVCGYEDDPKNHNTISKAKNKDILEDLRGGVI